MDTHARAATAAQTCILACSMSVSNPCSLTCSLSACRCTFMPRDKGGIGRTGKKHKKKSKFDVHRQIKGGDGADTSAAPTTANSPGRSAVEVDAGAGGALHTRTTRKPVEPVSPGLPP